MAEKHIPALDGIRGIAVLLVLFCHGVGAWPFTIFKVEGWLRWVFLVSASGWWGVDLFFVLSGFLITGILLDTKTASNRAVSFYARRFLRIFPIYYLTLLVVLLLCTESARMRAFVQPDWRTWLSLFLYLQNLTVSWTDEGNRLGAILGHLWSLAVEEQFYLIWPMLVWSLAERTVLRICVAGAAAALLLRIALVSFYGPHLWIHQLTVTRGEGLLVGSALAILASRGQKISPKLIIGMGCVGAGLIGLIGTLHPREFIDTNSGPLIYTIGVSAFALFCGAFVASSQYRLPFLTAALEWGWLRSFGKYSYGIYIYHVPLRFVFRYWLMPALALSFPLPLKYAVIYLLIFVSIAFVVAWCSYNFFEVKFLRLKRNFRAVYHTGDAVPVLTEALGPQSKVATAEL